MALTRQNEFDTGTTLTESGIEGEFDYIYNNALTLVSPLTGNLACGGNSITGIAALTLSANDGGALGASGTAFSDLFLASGGVVNWNAGNVTLTHSAGTLTLAGVLSLSGSATNAQAWNVKTLTELTTIAAAATTDTAIQIPLNAVVFAVSVRVTVAIPTAATFTVIGTTTSTAFNTAALSTVLNSTDVGTQNTPYKNGAAQTIRITPNLTPVDTTGRVRVTIHYYDITVPTS